jgi:hypothetical protein
MAVVNSRAFGGHADLPEQDAGLMFLFVVLLGRVAVGMREGS